MLLMTHLVFFGLLSYVLDIRVSLIGFIFSALPDIDNPGSIIGQMFPRLSNYLMENFGHRGLLHSIWPLAFLGALTLLNLNFFELLIAYASHIFLDSLNIFGVMIFYPINARFVLLDLKIKAGGFRELLLNLALLVAGSAYACYLG